jgi:hypothetical protein
MDVEAKLEPVDEVLSPSTIDPDLKDGGSRRRIRLLLWICFGGLLLLMGIIGLSAISFLYQIQIRQAQIQQDYVERDRTLEKLRSGIYLSGTYIRDFLLDPDAALAEAHKKQFSRHAGKFSQASRSTANSSAHRT